MKQNDRYINDLKVFQSVQKNSWHRFVDLRLILTIWTWSTIWQQVIRKCQRIPAIPFFNGWGWDGTKILLCFATFRFLWLDLTSDRRLWGNGRRGQLSENQTNQINLNLILQFNLTRPCGHFDPHPCQSDPLDLDHDHSLMSCCATMWLFWSSP